MVRSWLFEPSWILAGIFALGVLLRLSQYWARRSLWLDEASLALNFNDGNLGKVLRPLEHAQMAPVGFNLLSLFMVRIAGISEWSLRFLPLLFGLAAIFAFWRLSRRSLRGGALLFANYMFAISSTLVYYSNEFKPYILDVLLGIIVFSGVLAWWEEGRPRSRLPGLAVLGCLVVWFSLPVVFVMAGAGGVVLAELRDFAAVTGAWLISFSCQYFLFVRPDLQANGVYLIDFWREHEGFMPSPPWQHPKWFIANFFGYFEDVAGLQRSGKILGCIFVCGMVELIRRRAAVRLCALLAPFALGLFFSALELYPFVARLALFSVPFALLICGEGVEALQQFIRWPACRVAILGIVLVPPTAFTVPQIWKPVKVEEVRPLTGYLRREAGSQDIILVFTREATVYDSAMEFYARLFDLKQTILSFTDQDYAVIRPRIAREFQQGHRCWLVMSHVSDSDRASVFLHLQPEYRLRVVDQQVGAQLLAIEKL